MIGHRIFETQDGSNSLFSEQFGVSYHSKYGAWQETQHVFIEAGLRYKAIDRQQLSVLDIGFGTGLNCIASVIFCLQKSIELNYIGYEAFPVPAETIAALDYGKKLAWSSEESQIFKQIHDQEWGFSKNLNIADATAAQHVKKCQATFESIEETDTFDVIYYDAFAPNAQPELWTEEMFTKMYRALKPEGVLVTYCAKGQVKRNMKAAGLVVEKLKGPPGKREMTRASKEI